MPCFLAFSAAAAVTAAEADSEEEGEDLEAGEDEEGEEKAEEEEEEEAKEAEEEVQGTATPSPAACYLYKAHHQAPEMGNSIFHTPEPSLLISVPPPNTLAEHK